MRSITFMRLINPLMRLRTFVSQHPSQRAAAEALGIKPAYMSDLLHGRRDFSPRMLEKLGLKRVTVAATVLMACLFTACSSVNSSIPQSVHPAGIGPSAIGSLFVSDTSERLVTLANSCPNGQPDIPRVGLVDGRADFTWTHVPNVELVEVELRRMDVTNVTVPGGHFTETSAVGLHAFRPDSDGTYYARLRTRSCGTRWSPWSDVVVFSTEFHDGGRAEADDDTESPPNVCVPAPGWEFCWPGGIPAGDPL